MNADREAARRTKIVKSLRTSTELEGSRSTPATRADQDAYADGLISIAALVEPVRRRHDSR